MENIIFYYTGTGNSLWVARILAKELGNCQVQSITDWQPLDNSKEGNIRFKNVGLVFPVHIWGVPRRVLEFLDEIVEIETEYFFAIANNGGQVSNSLIQLKSELNNRGRYLDNGWSVHLPSNYIPWGGPGPENKQQQLFAVTEKKILSIAEKIKKQEKSNPEKGPLWQRILFTQFYKRAFSYVPKMDEKFWADEKCNSCGICEKICPAKNIVMEEGRPHWENHCEQCLACIQWCPQEAIQYGKKTIKYKRYHHPEVKLKDMVN